MAITKGLYPFLSGRLSFAQPQGEPQHPKRQQLRRFSMLTFNQSFSSMSPHSIRSYGRIDVTSGTCGGELELPRMVCPGNRA